MAEDSVVERLATAYYIAFKRRMWRYVVAGWTLHAAFISLVMDYYGQVGMHHQIEDHWMAERYSVPMAILCVVGAVWLLKSTSLKAFQEEAFTAFGGMRMQADEDGLGDETHQQSSEG